MVLSSSLHQNRVVLSFPLRTARSSSPMAAAPRFKPQCPSSFATPFLTPPTVSYTCQHPSIPPALLGCHSKSGQVWPHGMEPIISKLSRRPCNQGELLPSPILGGVRSHPPGSKQGHSYLTYPWNQLKVIDMLNDHARNKLGFLTPAKLTGNLMCHKKNSE